MTISYKQNSKTDLPDHGKERDFPFVMKVTSQAETHTNLDRNLRFVRLLQVYPSDKYEMAFKNNKAVLIIHNPEIDDAGVYRCEAVNKIGRDETEAKLTVYSTKYSFFVAQMN